MIWVCREVIDGLSARAGHVPSTSKSNPTVATDRVPSCFLIPLSLRLLSSRKTRTEVTLCDLRPCYVLKFSVGLRAIRLFARGQSGGPSCNVLPVALSSHEPFLTQRLHKTVRLWHVCQGILTNIPRIHGWARSL